MLEKNGQIEEIRKKILPPDTAAQAACRQRWNSVAKPLHSLGKLEDLLIQIAGIQRSADIRLEKKALVIMCADNGVVEEGVTQTGQDVTAIVAENFLTGDSSVAIMCKETGTDLFAVDVGMASDTKVEKKKTAYGTANFTKGPAMKMEQACAAIAAGIEKVQELVEACYDIIATGEMGIGNTTTSSAMTAVFLERDPAEVTGKGAGLSSAGLERKIAAIRKGIEVNRPDGSDPLDVLCKVGGFDIAGLTGVFLGGALYGIPVVIDGFISAVAALTAVRMAPACRDYILPSHRSDEPAVTMVMEALDKSPCIDAAMCLGEGTGAVALFPLLDLAAAIYHQMGTFEDIKVEAYEDFETAGA